MDSFKGNRRLEAAIYEGMDYALYSRHDISETFMPFMMLFKDGKKKLIRLAYEGDPNIGFAESLSKTDETFDQIVMCFEGRIPFENTKHDAIIVKEFDTSDAEGLLFIQRFQGIESGKDFRKLGRMSLASKTEQLPDEIVNRTSNKDIEEPYISGIVLKEPNGLKSREVIAGHENLIKTGDHQLAKNLLITKSNIRYGYYGLTKPARLQFVGEKDDKEIIWGIELSEVPITGDLTFKNIYFEYPKSQRVFYNPIGIEMLNNFGMN